MGLALDEPRDNDQSHTVDGLKIIIDPFAAKLVKDAGGLTIRNSIFGPQAELQGVTGCSGA
ncbi:MAG: hypothetical protein LDL33_04670 [Desulfomonile sp.]|nr:hypothetical protein [Desulfomonile sp.]